MALRIAIAELKQESNTFAKFTNLEDFKSFHLYEGTQISSSMKNTNSEISGFFEVLEENDCDIFPIMAAFSMSGGPVNEDTFNELVNTLVSKISKLGHLDGILIALHGAMVTEGFADADAEILQRIRNLVGTQIPICVSMDLHANLTTKKMDLATSISGFHTCPHTDLKLTGIRAAKILMRILKQESQPKMVMIKLPLVIPASMHLDSHPGPYQDVLSYAFSKTDLGLIDISVFTVQPWLDIENLGSAVLVVAEGNLNNAGAIANDIALNIWEKRHELNNLKLHEVGPTLEKAYASNSSPIILSDLADNNMAGSPGDSTVVIEQVISMNNNKIVFSTITDPVFVENNMKLKIGEFVTGKIGGLYGSDFYHPIEISGEIISKGDISFILSQQSYHGYKVNLGNTIVIKINQLFIVVTSKPAMTSDPKLYQSVGLDIDQAHVIVVKSHAAFKDGYRNLMKDFYLLNTPGMSSDNLSQLKFKNIKDPLYPWDKETKFHPSIYRN